MDEFDTVSREARGLRRGGCSAPRRRHDMNGIGMEPAASNGAGQVRAIERFLEQDLEQVQKLCILMHRVEDVADRVAGAVSTPAPATQNDQADRNQPGLVGALDGCRQDRDSMANRISLALDRIDAVV